jgi:peptide/nickel transport system ATP-binding protein
MSFERPKNYDNRSRAQVSRPPHDLRIAAQVCDEIAVMRYGEIVERGATVDVFTDPQHAYTRELLAAVPGRNWVPPDCREATAVRPA